jgi:hypothetical protein
LPKERPWQADGGLQSLEGIDRNVYASRVWKGDSLESHCELHGVRCAIKERFSLNRLSKYAKLHNLVSRLLRFLIAFPSTLTLYKQVLAATDMTLDPASDRPYTIITVTDSGVYPSTSAEYGLNTNKRKGGPINGEGFHHIILTGPLTGLYLSHRSTN